jgi:predicted GIY-YIG superfamily endonuclease
MASKRNGTLYVGVTSDIGRRAFEHRTGAAPGFTKRYRCTMLVWFEPHERMDEAIVAKSRSRQAAGRTSSL